MTILLPQLSGPGGRTRWSASRYLRVSCRTALAEVTDEREYAAAFDRYEFLRGMLEIAYAQPPVAALGEFVNRPGSTRAIPAMDEITEQWPLLMAGAFDGDPDTARSIYTKLSTHISQRMFS